MYSSILSRVSNVKRLDKERGRESTRRRCVRAKTRLVTGTREDKL